MGTQPKVRFYPGSGRTNPPSHNPHGTHEFTPPSRLLEPGSIKTNKPIQKEHTRQHLQTEECTGHRSSGGAQPAMRSIRRSPESFHCKEAEVETAGGRRRAVAQGDPRTRTPGALDPKDQGHGMSRPVGNAGATHGRKETKKKSHSNFQFQP